jgi:hypothetical protein
MRAVLMLCAAVALSGCTIAQSASFAVSRYCSLPAEARAANRHAVALALMPNRISIHCLEAE